MKKLILLIGLLLLSATLSEATLKESIDAKILLVDKTQPETVQQEAISKIVDEETIAEVNIFSNSIAPIEIDVLKLDVLQILIYDFGYQARELNKTFLFVQQSEKLKKVLRMIPSKQYPIVKFPFLETTSDDPTILTVNVDRWLDIKKMQDTLKGGNYKLVMLMSDSINNASHLELGSTVEQFLLSGKEFEIVYQAVKEIRPDVPVGFVAVMHPQLAEWLKSFTIQPDVWLLFNLPELGSNWQKVKTKWFAGKTVIANLNHHSDRHDYGGQKLGSVKYKETIKTLEALGYQGSIWWR